MRYLSRVQSYKSLLRYHQSQPSSRPTSPSTFYSFRPLPSQLTTNSLRPTAPLEDPNSFDSRIQRIPRSYCRSFGLDSRTYATQPATELDVNKVIDEINLKFAEAREEIDMAMDSKETVYFDEEAECARVAVKEVVDMFEGLLAKLPEAGKATVQRSMGLKMEQLKAELKQLDD